jgi:hypothetical protein
VQRVQPGAVRDEAQEQLILQDGGRDPSAGTGLVAEGAARILAATGGLLVQHRVWDRFTARYEA